MKNISYDVEHDVLYITFGDKSNSYGVESDNGITVLRNWLTDAAVGLIIMDATKLIIPAQPEEDAL